MALRGMRGLTDEDADIIAGLWRRWGFSPFLVGRCWLGPEARDAQIMAVPPDLRDPAVIVSEWLAPVQHNKY